MLIVINEAIKQMGTQKYKAVRFARDAINGLMSTGCKIALSNFKKEISSTNHPCSSRDMTI